MAREQVDIGFKKCRKLFVECGLDIFNENRKIVGYLPTEFGVVENRNILLDMLVRLEDDTILHIEFLNTYEGEKSLVRFHEYDEQIIKQITGAKYIKTIVVYTCDVKDPISSIDYGNIFYHVTNVSLLDFDGDKIISDIKDKLDNGEKLKNKDLISLTFASLMGGEKSKYEKIYNTIELLPKLDETYRMEISDIVLGFSEKFLNDDEKRNIKELSKMKGIAYEFRQEGKEEGILEGILKGREEGREEGILEVAKKMLDSNLSVNHVIECTGLSKEDIEKL